MDENTLRYRKLFQKYCVHWPDDKKRQYLNIPNDQTEIDDIELESAIELVTQVMGKPPVE
jgi:hypothetical protein